MKNKQENMKKHCCLRMMDPSDRRTNAFQVTAFFILLLLVFPVSTILLAQGKGNSATQSLMLQVKPITKISVKGNPNPLIITDANSGNRPASVVDENTKYSLVTNMDNMKIVASISDRMPAGTKLIIKLASSRSKSVGSVDLSNASTPVDVVTGIRRGSEADQSISYTFAANSDVTEIPAQSRMITLTLTN